MRRWWLALLLGTLLVLPLWLDRELNTLMATLFVVAIAAIGLDILTGWCGQVSLGHAFFLGIGAYTAAALGGDPAGRVVGLGLDMLVWLPAAGVVAAAVGVVVAPLATRLGGLYLAIVTLGLVLVGEHLFREVTSITGGAGIGRPAPDLVLAGVDLDRTSSLRGIVSLDREMKLYLLCLALLVALAVIARNLTSSAVGRAFAAVRDRGAAAELVGIDLTRHKIVAFAVSSFYAGVAGALLATITGFIEPRTYGLLYSVEFLAVVFIGGAGSLTGVLLGAMFVTLMPRLVQELPSVLPFVTSGSSADGFPSTFQLQTMIYGALIVAFLILEPRGLLGLCRRARGHLPDWPLRH